MVGRLTLLHRLARGVSFLTPTPHAHTDKTFELTVKQADLDWPDSLHDRPFGSLQAELGKRDDDNSAIILLPHRWTHTNTGSQKRCSRIDTAYVASYSHQIEKALTAIAPRTAPKDSTTGRDDSSCAEMRACSLGATFVVW